MKASDFEYELPQELIAYYPLKERDSSRLMVLNRKEHTVKHKTFHDITKLLVPGDLLVMNNTKVIPARLYCRTGNGKETDILLEHRIDSQSWTFLMKKPREGLTLHFEGGPEGRVVKGKNGEWMLHFSTDADEFIDEKGLMPLPPYIDRKPEQTDRETYQTVYASKNGAIAAPTAGLHFTDQLLAGLAGKGISFTEITLHVGIGTFRPVKTDGMDEHKMHSEYVEIPEKSSARINEVKKQNRRVIAVGTTVVRALESSVDDDGYVNPGSFSTDLFIHPPYKFHVIDAMITNFHIPRSTLLMLVCAFAGKEYTLNAYKIAVENKYRFLSYGDAMFIE